MSDSNQLAESLNSSTSLLSENQAPLPDASDVVSDVLPHSETGVETSIAINLDKASDSTPSSQQIDKIALTKKYFTELTFIKGKKYRFCKNIAVNQCRDVRLGTEKGRYAFSTSGTVLKKHVEVCFNTTVEGIGKLSKKPDIRQTKLLTKKDHDEHLALALVENLVC